MSTEVPPLVPATRHVAERTTYSVLFAIAFSHLLNDTIQSLIPAIYPVVKGSFNLSFAQVGLITLTFQLTASILQPLVGHWTDRKPQPFALVGGMVFTLFGLLALAWAPSFGTILLAVGLVGVGSSIFHPEASRMAYVASGGKRALAQSVFQLGGNSGSALGPLLAAAIIVPFGRTHTAWFSVLPLIAMVVLWQVGRWYLRMIAIRAHRQARRPAEQPVRLPRRRVIGIVGVLLLLIFSKQFYLASMSSYFTFYLIDKFGASVQEAQVHLFLFLLAAAVGTLLGGLLGDRIGYRTIIWASILGAAPFTLLMPYAGPVWTIVLSMLAGLILASAFSAILVYAQLLIPGRVGLVSGLFFGFAFGMAGLGSAVLGRLADATSIGTVFNVCSYLPLIGLLCVLLPNERASMAAERT
ncbi:MAG TPA: MFS transporter [Flavobacteriales bacterium]|nr:MFS transporter [Flavobacteriales bacterium]HNK39707.1 MFS transporter [Flavobacteriales bacterium]